MKIDVSCGPNVTQMLFTLRNIIPGRGRAQAEQPRAGADQVFSKLRIRAAELDSQMQTIPS